MEWKTRETVETFGDTALRIHALESLEKTIDDLFEELSRTGNPELLEELCPYFGCVWPSARGLTEFLAAQPLEKNGAMSFLEIGCGLAIPTMMVLLKTRLSIVTASDFHPEVPKFLEKNLETNLTPSARERFRYLRLDWRSPEEGAQRYHWVIGSDVLYEKAHPEDVAEALCKLVRAGGRITIADPGRPYLQKFVDEMKARGWSAEPQVLEVPDSDGKSPKEIFLFDFRPIGRAPSVFGD